MRHLLLTVFILLSVVRANARASSSSDQLMLVGRLHAHFPICDKAWRDVEIESGRTYTSLLVQEPSPRIRGGVIRGNAYAIAINVFYIDGSSQFINGSSGAIRERPVSSIQLYGTAGCNLNDQELENEEVKLLAVPSTLL